MGHKAYVILNPVAGSCDPEQIKKLLATSRSDGLLNYNLYETTGEEDLQAVVHKALQENYDLVLACGGDGTVSGVADGLANSDVPLGILPAGTTNSFASALGIPKNLKDALALVISNQCVMAVDAIKWNERFFILEASLGIFSASFEDVDRKKKGRLGWLAYVDATIRNWVGLDTFYVRLIVDGIKYSCRASEVALFNTSQVGIINEDLDADILFNDSTLDLYVLRSKSLLDLLRIFLYRLVGKPRKAPQIRYWRVKNQVQIESDPVVSFQADGDVQGETPAYFEVAPAVLQVIVPGV
jgi:diacylglycerol kinase (ATP)